MSATAITALLPLSVEHDGQAAMNPPEECLFLVNAAAQRVAVFNHDVPDAVEFAHHVAHCVNQHATLVEALQEIGTAIAGGDPQSIADAWLRNRHLAMPTEATKGGSQ